MGERTLNKFNVLIAKRKKNFNQTSKSKIIFLIELEHDGFSTFLKLDWYGPRDDFKSYFIINL